MAKTATKPAAAPRPFSLTPAPTFHAPATIHVPGQEPATIKFEYRHVKPKDLDGLLAELSEMGDAEIVTRLTVGWDLPDEFNEENVEALVGNYLGAGSAVVNGLLAGLTPARQGN